jgi:hypothetical protein
MKLKILVNRIGSKVDILWRKKYLKVLVVLAVFGTPALVLMSRDINSILVFYTLIAIIWYSRETMDLKRISNKQFDLLRIEHKTSLRPYLRLQKETSSSLILVNEGKGVAVNLKTAYISNSIRKELLAVPAMSASPGSLTRSFIPRDLGLELDPYKEEFTVEIFYNDIEGRNYKAVFRSNTLFNDGFEIVKQEEVKM